MITRRRFLTLAAACTVSPAAAASPVRWQGRAFGADAEITLHGPDEWALPLLKHAEKTLRDVENLFSLFDPQSSLSRLNGKGFLIEKDARFHRLMELAGIVHRATDGLFDPTVQPLWRALAEGNLDVPKRQFVGWHRIRRDGSHIRLSPGQEITLNGIAQGFATDLIVDLMRQAGATRTLVNMGEFGAVGGPWRVGISDPVHGLLAQRTLSNCAIATSSPGALQLSAAESHILNPVTGGPPVWSTVSVEAHSATIADGLSTALCHADLKLVQRISQRLPGIKRVTLIDSAGDMVTV
ncbi:FAD:protein FMN transferase [Hoeflea sp. TYP-13]|uniref:FAD:protein FMN transferase n=1 Tax=Hoeflea sp. TYP-13 TaxID=3230023 RepID=UPI0034C604CE